MSPRSSRTLPDELVLEIISRLGTVNAIVRCSSLLSKQWRNAWRSIGGGLVLDFDASDETLRRWRDNNSPSPSERSITDEEKRQFANRVDRAMASLDLHHRQNLDALKIGFHSAAIEEGASRWIEFALTQRVKTLSLSSYYTPPVYYKKSPAFAFLAEHDLRRLEVVEFYGLPDIPEEAVDHLLSNSPSLRRLALRSCEIIVRNGEINAVIRVDSRSSKNNLECLELEEIRGVSTIELVSAPRLVSFKFTSSSRRDWQIEFGNHDELPLLKDTLFSCRGCLLPWSGRGGGHDKFREFVTTRLHRLGIQVADHNFIAQLPAATPKSLRFEKLRVLDLFIPIAVDPPSFLECTVLLLAAPVLRELSIWFKHSSKRWRDEWKRRELGAEDSSSTWKHPSLEVLQLHGVHPNRINHAAFIDYRACQLQLAACIIMNSPSLNRVVIDTRLRDRLRDSVGKTRLGDSIDAHMCGAKMELEMQLQGRSASPRINFIYQ